MRSLKASRRRISHHISIVWYTMSPTRSGCTRTYYNFPDKVYTILVVPESKEVYTYMLNELQVWRRTTTILSTTSTPPIVMTHVERSSELRNVLKSWTDPVDEKNDRTLRRTNATGVAGLQRREQPSVPEVRSSLFSLFLTGF